MKAIILAAGLGTRLRPMTDQKPKCMVKVAGKPILQHQIDAYLQAGVEQVVVVVGYLKEVVESFCATYGERVTVISNDDYATTNNMYSLHLAMKQVGEEEFLLSNGDVVYDYGIIRDMFSASIASIASDKGTHTDESMKIVVDGDAIIDISKQISPDTAYGNSIDLYRFDKTAAKRFRDTVQDIIEVQKELNEWTEVALQRMLNSREIDMQPFDIEGRNWVEIDNYEDLALADEKFSSLDPDSVDLFFIDLDGTLYLGDREIQGAKEFVGKLNSNGKQYMFLSNNSSKDKKQYVEKLSQHGISTTTDSILLSSDGAIASLVEQGIKRVFVLGTEALRNAVEEAGIKTTGEGFEAVLLGYDTELTYEKLKNASILINNGTPYFATHFDVVCPTPEGPIPDIGSMIALLEKSTGISPKKIFGKPSAEMVSHIIKERKVNMDNVAFIGDRLYTDMAMARNAGAKFVLVLSGETGREDVEDIEDVPDMIISSVSRLF